MSDDKAVEEELNALAAETGVDEKELSKVIETEEAGEAGEEKLTARQLVATMTKEGGAGVWKDTVSNYSSSSIEGVTKKGDIMHVASDMAGCLAAMKKLVDAAKAKGGKKVGKWDFKASPHAYFKKTLDDTFVAFLMWGRVATKAEDQEADDEGKAGMINVSKAFRRLEAYADWIDDASHDLMAKPLTASANLPGIKAWGMSMSHSKDGMLLWWVDLEQLDLKAIKGDGDAALTVEDSMRAFVWLAHAAMFDQQAQHHGMAFIENVAAMGFLQTIRLAPMKLSVKLDKLTMGLIPIKMKCVLCLDSPRWMKLLMRVMSVFMSKKIQSRVHVLKKEWGKPGELFGAECVPKGFGECNGALTVDPLVSEYLALESPRRR